MAARRRTKRWIAISAAALIALWLIVLWTEGTNANWQSYRRIQSGMSYWNVIAVLHGFHAHALADRTVFLPEPHTLTVRRWCGEKDWIDVGFDGDGNVRWKEFHPDCGKDPDGFRNILRGHWSAVRE